MQAINFVAKTIRTLSIVWFVLGCLVILLGVIMTWYSKGFWAVQEMLSPFNLSNFFAVAITLAPGYALLKLADALENRQWRLAIGAGLVLPASLGVIALVAYLAYMSNQETDRESKKTREHKVSSIKVMNASATMYADRNYLVTSARGPVGSEGISQVIKLGDKITVKDRSITVNHIFVTEILEDMAWDGKTLGRRGDVHCLLVEKLEDNPSVDENANRNRLWINITDCKPE